VEAPRTSPEIANCSTLLEVDDDAITRAMAAQEYFWYLQKSDPEPSSYALEIVLALDGPLDRARFVRAVEDTLNAHDIFRTAFREIDERVFQAVERDAPRFALTVAPAEQATEIADVLAELTAQLDLARGAMVHGRLLAFGPERHVLAIVLAHAVCDGVSRFMVQREILWRYRHGAGEPDQRPAAYLEYADAFARFATSAEGRERLAWWHDHMRDARPLALPYDFPRDAVDARRDAAPFGIIAEPMHPVHAVEVPAALRQAITRVARANAVTASVVYLATLLRLLEELAQQQDIVIETVFDGRSDRRVAPILGPIATWTTARFDLSSCRTWRDTLPLVTRTLQDVFQHSVMPERFATVPPQLRGTCFNYLPNLDVGMTVGDLAVSGVDRPFPLYKRHWDLILLVFDSTRGGLLCWTGNQHLWRRETIEQLAQRYVAMLQQQLDAA
jgi:hypothetical protein